MASITDIKVKILELAAAPFQEFCDTLLSKMGYGTIHGLGMKAGTGNTTIGNPDTYFRSDIAEAIGLYWAKYALAFSFRPTEMGRGNKMVCYHLELTHSNELKEFRAICWSILISLSTNKKWLPKIFTIMDEYSRNIQGNPDYDVVNGEVEYVEKVLEALNSDQISFLKMLRRLLKNADAMNINYDNAWRKKFSGNQWMLYQLLENDFVASELEYEDYKKQREEKLVEYGKQLKIEDIKNWVTSANDLLSDKLLDRDTFTINQGIQQIVNQMDVDELQEFLKAYIEHGTNMNVRPWSILEKLNKLADSTALLLYIKESTFPQKDEWMFSFFETLPKEKVNVKYMEELLGYLRSDLDKSITSSSFRDLRMLDKFMIIDSNIYPVVCDIIYEKRNYNSFIAEMYLEGLFNDKIYSPNELLLLFNDNINLLQEIYFYMLERGQFTDYSGVFLLEFLMLGESWLQKYAELFWKVAEKHRDHDYHIYEALWETDDYIKEKLLDDLWNLLHNRNKVNINLLTESDVQTYDVGEDIIIVITVPMAKYNGSVVKTKGRDDRDVELFSWDSCIRRLSRD